MRTQANLCGSYFLVAEEGYFSHINDLKISDIFRRIASNTPIDTPTNWETRHSAPVVSWNEAEAPYPRLK